MSTHSTQSTTKEHTFLIAVTVTGWPSRTRARRHVYDLMAADMEGRAFIGGGGLTSWHDAGVDHTDHHDEGEAVWAYPGRGIEAQRALVAMGYAPEVDMAIGHHPGVWVIRDGERIDGNVLCFECTRCNNASDDPAVLAEVPCIDLSKWEHGHYWVSNEEDPIQRIECLSDCGMTIEFGQAVGAVSTEHAGSPPD
jgi:hypothetical protein